MEPSGADTPLGIFRCLVADDSLFARKNISQVICSMGGEVVAEASNGAEALELFKQHSPDLVLLDITMPEMDGVDTLRRIMEVRQDAKVIMVSSVGHKEMVWRAISLGARHFVLKPYSAEYAGMIIRSVVQQ